MCWALYAASDHDFACIPWSGRERQFGIQRVDAADAVRKQFGRRNVVYLSAYDGCGCGFMSVSETDVEDIARRQQTVRELAEVLASISKRDQVELFLCWEGDQSKAPRVHVELSADCFVADDFPMQALDFVSIVPN